MTAKHAAGEQCEAASAARHSGWGVVRHSPRRHPHRCHHHPAWWLPAGRSPARRPSPQVRRWCHYCVDSQPRCQATPPAVLQPLRVGQPARARRRAPGLQGPPRPPRGAPVQLQRWHAHHARRPATQCRAAVPLHSHRLPAAASRVGCVAGGAALWVSGAWVVPEVRAATTAPALEAAPVQVQVQEQPAAGGGHLAMLPPPAWEQSHPQAWPLAPWSAPARQPRAP